MKKFLPLVLMFTLVFALTAPCFALEPEIEFQTSHVEENLDGMVVETILTVYHNYARAYSKPASITKTYRASNGDKMVSVTLNADFGYDGNQAWVRSTYSNVTEYNNWSYGSERISESGGTATLTARLTKSGETSHNVNLSITCSPNGTITEG